MATGKPAAGWACLCNVGNVVLAEVVCGSWGGHGDGLGQAMSMRDGMASDQVLMR